MSFSYWIIISKNESYYFSIIDITMAAESRRKNISSFFDTAFKRTARIYGIFYNV